MRRAALLAVVVGALSGASFACEQLTGVSDLSVGDKPRSQRPASGGDDEEAGGGGPDGGTTDAPVASPDTGSGGPSDTGTDTTPPACSALPTNDTFPAALGAEWLLLGNAAAAMPGVRLTPSAMSMTGALWWAAQQTFDRFEVTFAYVITTDANSTTYGPGDGMTFAWVQSNTAPALGGTGGGLAVQGLTGFAVAIDAYTNTEYGDPATPNISLKNTLDMTTIAATAVNAALIDGNQHSIKVRLVDGLVTIALDGANVLGPTTLPGYVPFAGYWGFGAGTGGAFEDQLLKSATARIGTTGPCAAP